MYLRNILLALFLAFVCFSTLFGQTSTGTVNGTLIDQAGAAVPGATVKLTSQATKIERQATSNQDGYFTFVNVQPGDYTIYVEASGFKRTVTAPFTLGVSETSTQNISLAVGNVSETV
ncbi:MAG TPA: carboxypeptidase-like regulatory domain-containing protein, partial [Pyrinomonadaceae bacterium]|nr:carboxypeptidase-like regulatory domain-containing protein [Pyrinomonadaceae bacterium]